jgi:hypothetical protein
VSTNRRINQATNRPITESHNKDLSYADPKARATPMQAYWSKHRVPTFHVLKIEPLQFYNSYVTNNCAKNKSVYLMDFVKAVGLHSTASVNRAMTRMIDINFLYKSGKEIGLSYLYLCFPDVISQNFLL